MDDSRMYTPEEMSKAERLSDAVKRVPKQKQEEFIRAIELMAMGAEMAERTKAS